jgi:putative hydrolase of the HAD superfamily
MASVSRLPADTPSVELLLFDLGGVLVDFSGPRELGKFLRAPLTPDEILRRWIECPHTEAFERGRISSKEWVERFVKAWDVTLSPDEFLKVFRMMTRRVLPGARALLDQLRSRYRLAVLSNSNALHWDRNTHELKLIELFEFAISSHQVGLCKPDPAIFALALERAQLPPQSVMFFDDLPANVAAAASAGIHARQVRGIDELRCCLMKDNLL